MEGIDERLLRVFDFLRGAADSNPEVIEHRLIAGVNPVEDKVAISGPGSENRTRFLDFCGVDRVSGYIRSVELSACGPSWGDIGLIGGAMDPEARLRRFWPVSMLDELTNLTKL
jgi:hypothetical protein